MPRRKNWRKSVCRREVLYGEVSINASPDQLQANGSPAKCRQMEVLPNAGKWKSCQMQANGSPVQLQANGSPVQVQANGSRQCKNGKTSEKTSETNVRKRKKHLKQI